MVLKEENIRYFQKGEIDNKKFWARLGGMPNFKGKKVLDIGCGHGSLCIQIARQNPQSVLGIDTDRERINFANENLRVNHPKLQKILQFRLASINNLDIYDFDIITSKDTFEHIINLDQEFFDMKNHLKRGGRMYIGFGPLYNSPYGCHKRMHTIFPWEHLIVPEAYLLKRANKLLESDAKNIYDLGLNKWSFKKYEKLFNNSNLKIIYFKVNASDKISSKIFSIIRQSSFLKEYFSHNIYCILEKSA